MTLENCGQPILAPDLGSTRHSTSGSTAERPGILDKILSRIWRRFALPLLLPRSASVLCCAGRVGLLPFFRVSFRSVRIQSIAGHRSRSRKRSSFCDCSPWVAFVAFVLRADRSDPFFRLGCAVVNCQVATTRALIGASHGLGFGDRSLVQISPLPQQRHAQGSATGGLNGRS